MLPFILKINITCLNYYRKNKWEKSLLKIIIFKWKLRQTSSIVKPDVSIPYTIEQGSQTITGDFNAALYSNPCAKHFFVIIVGEIHSFKLSHLEQNQAKIYIMYIYKYYVYVEKLIEVQSSVKNFPSKHL